MLKQNTVQQEISKIEKDIYDISMQVEEKKKPEPLETPVKTEEMMPELIQGNVLDREIVYETPGGYVVKVTFKDNEEIETTYYSVSKIQDVEHALDNFKQYH